MVIAIAGLHAPSHTMASRCRFASISFAAVALLLAFAAPAWTAQGLAGDQSPVQRGEYLVQAANCVSCHTSTDGKAFAGYRFLGKIYSSNLTPDPETGLGSWSEDDFIRAMRNGVAPGGKYLFPAFPYTAFTKLSTPDIQAIYAYLRTLPAVHSAPAKASFWFRQRWVMALWNWLFFKPGEATRDRAQSDAWNRGSYLVEALGHCSACHTPRNLMFAERTDRHLTGGVEVAQVEDGKYRNWSAPNLTSAQSGLAQWSLDDLKKYLKTGYSRRAGVLGPMNEVIANSLRHLNDSDIAAMAIYLKSLPAKAESQRQTLSAGEHAAGQELYDKYCDECHLSSGRGGLRKAPFVAASAIVQTQNSASLVNVILYGATAAPGTTSLDAWDDMPGFKDKMSDAEASALVNFLRSNWDNRGARVAPAAIAAQR
jgi:mono/diheme cytochrome c family protein